MAKAAFNKTKTFHQLIGLEFKEETNKLLHLEHSWNLDALKSRSEIPFEM